MHSLRNAISDVSRDFARCEMYARMGVDQPVSWSVNLFVVKANVLPWGRELNLLNPVVMYS
jgi:hypothetical protein